ncbi:MAG: M48 family metalloprotease [Deltaproteobacteria bacterium]|nr:M48 family metalloprotease [Deltaproteobacteria bacterium]
MKKSLIATIIFLLCFGSAAHAVDLWQQLKDVFRPKSDKPSDPLVDPALRALTGFSEEEEIAIGRQAAGSLLGAAPLVNNLKLQEYVNHVGRWVASQSERAGLNWHFGVIDSNDINAFAAPGGYIFVTKGLYQLLHNESELAGVLAHEVGHVIRKHHLEILQQDRLVQEGTKILKKAVADNEYIKKLIGTGAEIFARSLDKRAEFEADRIAVVLAARAGYDAFGLPAVLQDIGHVAKDDSSVALLFKTHPHPNDRLDQLDKSVGTRLDALKGLSLEERFFVIAQ